MKSKLFKRISALILTLAICVAFMPMLTVSVDAASKKSGKVQVVTQEKDEVGNTTKFPPESVKLTDHKLA